MAATSSSVNESAGSTTVTVTMTGTSADPVTVTYALGGTATQDTDYTASPATLTFASGETSKDITIEGLADGADDDDPTETIVVTLDDPANASLGDSTHTITVTNDSEGPPIVSFSSSSSSVNESAGSTMVTVMMDRTSTEAVTVDYTLGGTATQGMDYAVSPSSLTFASGETSQSITVSGLADGADEDTSTETVVFTLQKPANASLGSDDTHTLTIANDSGGPPIVSFSSASSSVKESEGSTTVTVMMDRASSQAVTVGYSLGGTATQGADYEASPSSLTFASGETRKTITVSGLADGADEGSASETVVFTLQNPSNAILGSGTTHTLTITNDSAGPPIVSFSASSSAVRESAGSTTVAVMMDRALSEPVNVGYTLGGTATQGADYSASPSSLTFASGETSKVITISGLADGANDTSATETIVLTLQKPSNALLGSRTQHTVSVTNDSNAPVVVSPAPPTSSSGGGGGGAFSLWSVLVLLCAARLRRKVFAGGNID
jgi:uncharacterized protein YcfL